MDRRTFLRGLLGSVAAIPLLAVPTPQPEPELAWVPLENWEIREWYTYRVRLENGVVTRWEPV